MTLTPPHCELGRMPGGTYRSDPLRGGRRGCDESQVIGGDPAGLFFLRSAERHSCGCGRGFSTDWTLKGNWCKGSSTSSTPWVAGCVTAGRKRLMSSDKSMAIAHLGPALACRPPRTPGLVCTPQVISSLPESPPRHLCWKHVFSDGNSPPAQEALLSPDSPASLVSFQ